MDKLPITYSNIPARLDALPWSKWHWKVVIALGITWLLDGLELTMVGALGPILQRPKTLGLSIQEIGWAASAYMAGALLGALYFGWLADRLGRRRLFLVTLSVYLIATLLTAFTFDFLSFSLCRFLTGFGIGGEYAAINSAVDELIPARIRGTVDIAINGTYWLGALIGAGLTVMVLNSPLISSDIGWRLIFGFGALVSVAIILVRKNLPESPRWLIAQGQHDVAKKVIKKIEKQIGITKQADHVLRTVSPMRPHSYLSWFKILGLIFTRLRSRSIVGLSLMIAQVFFYNTIFFTYAFILNRFYGVSDIKIGYYIFPFALVNFFGPLLLGPLFDRLGRRIMISATYSIAGLGLLGMGYAFAHQMLTTTTLTLSICALFFVASAAASSAYLTVSETFPVEIRAISISLFYAIGTGVGGLAAPVLLSAAVATGSRQAIFSAFILASVLMCIAAIIMSIWGVDAERQPLEESAHSLFAV